MGSEKNRRMIKIQRLEKISCHRLFFFFAIIGPLKAKFEAWKINVFFDLVRADKSNVLAR